MSSLMNARVTDAWREPQPRAWIWTRICPKFDLVSKIGLCWVLVFAATSVRFGLHLASLPRLKWNQPVVAVVTGVVMLLLKKLDREFVSGAIKKIRFGFTNTEYLRDFSKA